MCKAYKQLDSRSQAKKKKKRGGGGRREKKEAKL